MAGQQLQQAAQLLEQNKSGEAVAILDQVLREHGKLDDVGHRAATLFALALQRRLKEHKTASDNMYLRRYDIKQINLFSVLAAKYTPVALTTNIVTALLEDLIGDAKEVGNGFGTC